MTTTIDRRTRFAGAATVMDAEQLFADLGERLRDTGPLAAQGVELLGLPPLTFEVDGTVAHLVVAGGALTLREGRADHGPVISLDARVLCLDEPTAGVAQRETEAFGPLIKEIRRELGAAMLVIEHDMPLVMSISDRVYCLEIGRVIAEGDPVTVRNDPKVIASYLGVDERAIARSGKAPTAAVVSEGG